MATIARFEDIKAWQKARELTRVVYQLSEVSGFAKDFGLRDQIRRACVSVMANIAEGFGRHSDKEFANFLNVAHGSAAEAQSHLYVALDLGYLDKSAFESVYGLLNEASRMTLALARHLHRR